MKITNRKNITIMIFPLAIALFSGCSNQEFALANSLANSATASTGVNSSSFNPNSMLSSSASRSGLAQSQVIGAQMLMNPAVLGVGALGTAISEKNKAENRAAYGKLSAMMADPNKANSTMEKHMVRAYNKKYGTKYRTMQELQDSAKVSGYNKQEGTKFQDLDGVRKDYNRKKGTKFKNNNEFREYIAKTRG
ncbi:MAG TPA: hypothetical protein EYH57_02370 [Sulfurovum sp.]|nr:hypothetical protein [Sulfurovum sp.]